MSGADILLICQHGAQLGGKVAYGALHATLEVGAALQHMGCRVVLAGLSERADGEIGGLAFVGGRDDRELGARLMAMPRIETVIGISRADILGLVNAQRYVVYQHGPHFPLGRVPAWVLNAMNVPVVCVSRYSAQRQREFGIRQDLLHVVPNGYDAGVFNRRDSVPRNSHRLVFAGGLVEYKGFDVALQSFEAIKARYADAELHVFGPVYAWETSGNALRRRGWQDAAGVIDMRRIEHDVPGCFFHGEVDRSVLAEEFARSSLVIMPSRIAETFGLVSLEAQACGCIPVLPAAGGFPETVQPGVTGFLYGENTATALTDNVASLWNQGLPSEQQRQDAAEWVRSRFSWGTSARALLTVIEQAPSQAGRAGGLRPIMRRWIAFSRSNTYRRFEWRKHQVVSGLRKRRQPVA